MARPGFLTDPLVDLIDPRVQVVLGDVAGDVRRALSSSLEPFSNIGLPVVEINAIRPALGAVTISHRAGIGPEVVVAGAGDGDIAVRVGSADVWYHAREWDVVQFVNSTTYNLCDTLWRWYWLYKNVAAVENAWEELRIVEDFLRHVQQFDPLAAEPGSFWAELVRGWL